MFAKTTDQRVALGRYSYRRSALAGISGDVA